MFLALVGDKKDKDIQLQNICTNYPWNVNMEVYDESIMDWA